MATAMMDNHPAPQGPYPYPDEDDADIPHYPITEPSTTPHPTPASGLRYSDQFVKLYTNRLELLNYFMPFGTSKVIPITDIEAIQTAKELSMTWWDMREWGYVYNNGVWWAYDEMRDPQLAAETEPKFDTMVLTLKGDTMRKGFSVEEGALFLKHLRNLMNTQSA